MKALALLTFVSLTLALLMDQKLFERFARLWQQPLALAVLAFVLWISASILWASDKGEALRATVSFLGLLGLTVVIGLLERRYLLLAWAGFVFGAALSVPAAYILPLPADSDMAVSGRFGPAGADPNTYSLLVAIAFFAAYFALLRRHTIIAYLLAPVFLYGIFATGSRTGLIALVATPLLALFVPRLGARLGWRTLSMYVLGATAIAVIVLAIPSVGEPALERYMTVSQIKSEETWNGRWCNWEGALDIIASHPILGVGAGNYAEAALEYSESVQAHSASKGELAGVAHNMFLGVASQLGLVGLILFLGLLFLVVQNGSADRPEVEPGNRHIPRSYRGHDRGYDADVGERENSVRPLRFGPRAPTAQFGSTCTFGRQAREGTLDKGYARRYRFRRWRWGRDGSRQPIADLGFGALRCAGDKFTRPVRLEGSRGNPRAGRSTGAVHGQEERLRLISGCAGCPHPGAFSASRGTHPYLCSALCSPVYAVAPNIGDGTHRP